MNCILAVETTVKGPVSPGIKYGQCNIRDGKEDLAFKIIRPYFEEISLFHKKVTKHMQKLNPNLFEFQSSLQPLGGIWADVLIQGGGISAKQSTLRIHRMLSIFYKNTTGSPMSNSCDEVKFDDCSTCRLFEIIDNVSVRMLSMISNHRHFSNILPNLRQHSLLQETSPLSTENVRISVNMFIS